MFELVPEIVSNKRLTRDTWLVALRSPEIARAARPGQFVMIRVRSGIDPLLRRPFSICGVREDLFLVLYRVIGRGTTLMTELREGEKVQVLGPLGKGFAVPEKKSVSPVLVGGGIGIAPLVFLAHDQRAKDLTFMTGFRSAQDILPPQKITGDEQGVAVATDDGTRGHHGPVTDLLEMTLRKSRAAAVYACGPKPMLKKVAEMSAALRIPCQVSLEAHMACGLGACQGCAAKAAANTGKSFWYVCKEGPVFDAEEIDWEGF